MVLNSFGSLRLTLLCWLSLLLFITPGMLVADAARPPSFILVFADDLGYGDLGVYGQRRIVTVNLRRMAAEGITFTQFYSAAPHCAPARDALLTGRHTGHTTVRFDGVLSGDTAAEPRYLSRLLANAGYVTGMFGKWGMGDYAPRLDQGAQVTAGRPESLGFDEFLGYMDHRDAHTYTLPPYPLAPGDARIHPRLWVLTGGRTVEYPPTEIRYTHGLFIDRALDFIRRHQEEPFFLYLPLTLPHAELYLPPDDAAWAGYLDALGRSVFPEIPWPGNRTFRRPNPRPRATYAAMVTRLDLDVGRLLAEVDRLGLAQDTIVVVTSDNGPHDAGGIVNPFFFASNDALAGRKWSLHEGGIRVPMIAWGPGLLAGGRTVDDPMALWDLLPTLLDLAGLAPPPAADGLSMRPLLEGRAQPQHDTETPLYWETFNSRFHGQAARLGRWKAIRLGLGSPNDIVRLYDLENDPGEQYDVASLPGNCPQLLQLVALLNDSRTDPGPPFSIVPLAAACPGQPAFQLHFRPSARGGGGAAGAGGVNRVTMRGHDRGQ